MDCIYLNCENGKCYCHAQPIREREPIVWYKPSEDEIKNYCKNSKEFMACFRFRAFQQHIRFQSQPKK